MAGIEVTFKQAGEVILFNLSMVLSHHNQGKSDFESCIIGRLHGDRSYSYFGSKVKFVDLFGNSRQQLVINAPRRTLDVTEELYGG